MRRKKQRRSMSKARSRMLEAEKDFRRMWNEVEPFVEKREVKRYTTAGEWTSSSSELVSDSL